MSYVSLGSVSSSKNRRELLLRLCKRKLNSCNCYSFNNARVCSVSFWKLVYHLILFQSDKESLNKNECWLMTLTFQSYLSIFLFVEIHQWNLVKHLTLTYISYKDITHPFIFFMVLLSLFQTTSLFIEDMKNLISNKFSQVPLSQAVGISNVHSSQTYLLPLSSLYPVSSIVSMYTVFCHLYAFHIEV